MYKLFPRIRTSSPSLPPVHTPQMLGGSARLNRCQCQRAAISMCHAMKRQLCEFPLNSENIEAEMNLTRGSSNKEAVVRERWQQQASGAIRQTRRIPNSEFRLEPSPPPAPAFFVPLSKSVLCRRASAEMERGQQSECVRRRGERARDRLLSCSCLTVPRLHLRREYG